MWTTMTTRRRQREEGVGLWCWPVVLACGVGLRQGNQIPDHSPAFVLRTKGNLWTGQGPVGKTISFCWTGGGRSRGSAKLTTGILLNTCSIRNVQAHHSSKSIKPSKSNRRSCFRITAAVLKAQESDGWEVANRAVAMKSLRLKDGNSDSIALRTPAVIRVLSNHVAVLKA